VETTGKLTQFGTLEEVVRICKEKKACVPCIDFARIFARQGGEIDYKKVFDLIKPLGIRHLHTHFSDIEYTVKERGKGNERRHVPMNSLPDFKELAKEILKCRLNITIISESSVLEKDSLKMRAVFEKLGYK
jgi:deoxyribonuclease-4